jgi:hypothetical protein
MSLGRSATVADRMSVPFRTVDHCVYTSVAEGTLVGHIGTVYSAEFSRDGRLLVTASEDRAARVWSLRGRVAEPGAELSEQTGQVWNATFSPDGQEIVTASADGAARVYPYETFAPLSDLLAFAEGRVFPERLRLRNAISTCTNYYPCASLVASQPLRWSRPSSRARAREAPARGTECGRASRNVHDVPAHCTHATLVPASGTHPRLSPLGGDRG